jgi:hypothetical protein
MSRDFAAIRDLVFPGDERLLTDIRRSAAAMLSLCKPSWRTRLAAPTSCTRPTRRSISRPYETRIKPACDSMTQALKCLRDVGLAQTDEEARDGENARVTHRPRPKALYPC